MVRRCWLACLLVFPALLACTASASAQEQVGSIRGVVYDKEFEGPLGGAQVTIVERKETVATTDQGNFVFNKVPPGKYTLVFAKDGYTRQVKADVVVSGGKMTEVESSLPGEIVDMDDFVVQDPKMENTNNEEGLMALRMDSTALMNGVSSELMSKAAAGNAADGLKLVTGATVADGKYAVIRGLPDRYVVNQMNGVRLPTADVDKRAVQLDQFPSAVIDSIQVAKTFTPDQQGDASGGAVNIMLKSIPEKMMLKFEVNGGVNNQVIGSENFLTSKDGGVNFLGSKNRPIPRNNKFIGPVGVQTEDGPPVDYNWNITTGGSHTFDTGWKLGGLANIFYKTRDTNTEGVNDAWWITKPGAKLTPRTGQGTPEQGDFKTSLFDVKQSSQEVQYGGLGAVGLQNENNLLRLLYMSTRSATDTATLAEDTRGKKYFFPGYNVNDPTDPGNQARAAAPYLRTETLTYTERTTQTLQLSGKHTLPMPEFGRDGFIKFERPIFDWTGALSGATMDQPDKRQFGSQWWAESFSPGYPAYGVPAQTLPALYSAYKPAANNTIGNLQRVWKDIGEDSTQGFANLKLPFHQWSNDAGYFKFGVFDDRVNRTYNQDSFSNFSDNGPQSTYQAPWDSYWSRVFPNQSHPVTAADIDVDYKGKQDISALYYMADIPTCHYLNVIGGMRYETTDLSIINTAEKDARWFPPQSGIATAIKPGAADVTFHQDDALPSLGLLIKPIKTVQIHTVYSETVARQTFKELTPIQQQEFLGGDVFIGNPNLMMSSIKNYDIRADWTPFEDSLLSLSWFRKDVTNPIEYVQKLADFAYTTPENYPKGQLSGIELEARQKMGRFSEQLAGLTIGANATFIDSQVTLPEDEAAGFRSPYIASPMRTRDMTGAPAYLYNLFSTYEIPRWGTQFGLFYTVTGDTLVAGAGEANGNFIPNIYAKEYGTLNFTASQKLNKYWTVKFQAKNLLNPNIETVYRTDSEEKPHTSYTKGMEFWIGLSAEF